MKVLIAPNAFKGTIEADEAADIIRDALLEAQPNAAAKLSPIADGGDGTCYLLAKELDLPQRTLFSLDPLGRPVKGFYNIDSREQVAFLDVSTVSGIKYLNSYQKNPWITSTYGTGELIVSAIESGAKHVVLGLGGSATVDIGLGILRALGYLFLDENGRGIPVFSDGLIKKISHIQAPIRKPDVRFTCLCDVNNFFFGEMGAVPVFGPQKGLKQSEIPEFEKACEKVYSLVIKKSGIPIPDREGFGAAGGIALGLSAFFPTVIEMGAQWFFEKTGMESKIKNADLIITGEGQYDRQSAGGKGSFELLQLAKKHGKKIVLITSGEGGKDAGFDDVIQLPNLNIDDIKFKEKAKVNLFEAVKQAFSNSKLI